jgi:hypothetical protein
LPSILAMPAAVLRTPNAASGERGVPRSGCPGFVRISDIWPGSGQNPDRAGRDLAEFRVAQRLLFAPA